MSLAISVLNVLLCFVQVDLQFLDEVISNGADPNSCDRYGQTILHEVNIAFFIRPELFYTEVQ